MLWIKALLLLLNTRRRKNAADRDLDLTSIIYGAKSINLVIYQDEAKPRTIFGTLRFLRIWWKKHTPKFLKRVVDSKINDGDWYLNGEKKTKAFREMGIWSSINWTFANFCSSSFPVQRSEFLIIYWTFTTLLTTDGWDFDGISYSFRYDQNLWPYLIWSKFLWLQQSWLQYLALKNRMLSWYWTDFFILYLITSSEVEGYWLRSSGKKIKKTHVQ